MGKHRTGSRIPESVAGIQVNHCKNPPCPNFGRPASTEIQSRGPYGSESNRDKYIVKGQKDKNPRIQCTICGEKLPMKSNLAIKEEYDRLTNYFEPDQEPSCPDEACRNYAVGISTPKAYQSYGKTSTGAKRYWCTRPGCSASKSPQ